ncbi:MAG: glycosyl hydrolase family 25 [Prevotella sp.]|nr:glycosyl hydrolase family 25 [Prevotella sp.]
MKKILLLALCLIFVVVQDADARPRKKTRSKARTTRVVRKKRVVAKPKPPTIHENPYLCCEDTCGHVHGIDLSHYQGDVYWETVGQNTKMSYVYLKCTEGGDRIDDRYERNVELAHRHGLKVGSYHFFRPATNLQQQLWNFTRLCRSGEQDLIPMLDVETTGGLSTQAFCDSLHQFLRMLEQTYHQKPLVYTFRNFYNKHLLGKLDDYQLMIAMYTDEEPVLADERDYIIWQYSARGRISGVSTDVDKSRFMGSHSLRELRFRH